MNETNAALMDVLNQILPLPKNITYLKLIMEPGYDPLLTVSYRPDLFAENISKVYDLKLTMEEHAPNN